MKKIYKLILFFGVLSLMSFDKPNCGSIKNSNFKYRNNKKDIFVSFKGDKYIEYHNKKEHYIKADIKWVSECAYTLSITESNLPDFPFKKGMKLNISINKVSGKKVYYTANLAGRSWENRMTKI
jgi:hypothetical protein